MMVAEDCWPEEPYYRGEAIWIAVRSIEASGIPRASSGADNTEREVYVIMLRPDEHLVPRKVGQMAHNST